MEQEEQKPYHTLVLDAGPIIRNTPPVSTLIKNTHKLVTLPSVISEIRDEATRSRLEVTLKPFLDVREPRSESVKFVADFARRTGDLAVLSRTDLRLAGLSYELECERSLGDWRLRKVPGQKGLNGKPPRQERPIQEGNLAEPPTSETVSESKMATDKIEEPMDEGGVSLSFREKSEGTPAPEAVKSSADMQQDHETEVKETEQPPLSSITILQMEQSLSEATLNEIPQAIAPATMKNDSSKPQSPVAASSGDSADAGTESDSSSSDWITPTNLEAHIAHDINPSTSRQQPAKKPIEVATLTTDNALQNLLLRINLHILSTATLTRIKHLRTTVLRCHGCFNVIKDTTKQFCPRCGQATLTRVAASTNSKGEFQVHLKKNWQWNHRGERYSIPKPVAGTASGKKVHGGGSGGWGNGLILAEDQREYVKAEARQRRLKEKDLMNEDVLPGILSGDRGAEGGRPKVGAGRNVNSKRRKKR